MNDKSKEIELEINKVIEIVLHFDKYLLHKKEKDKQFNFSKNSIDLINEIIQSKKVTDFLCYDEKIIKHRNSIGIIKAINSMLNKDVLKIKNTHITRKINPISFNQSNLLLSSFYSSSEGEFYFINNIIRSKVLEIVKSCFELKFNQNQNEITNSQNANNENKKKFILISSNNLKKAKLRNRYYYSLIKNNNLLSMKNYSIRSDFPKLFDTKNLNNSNISIVDNSKIKNNHKSNSCINMMGSTLNKNSSLTNDKYTSMNLKYSSIYNSKNNKNIFHKRNIKLLNKRKINNDEEKSFMPLINIKDFKYKNELKIKPKNIPSFSSGMMELIHYNTKNNIKVKAEEEFLKECLKESYISLRKINTFDKSKCFVDYSKSSASHDNIDIFNRKKSEIKPKEKKLFFGFEYKNIFRYRFNGKLTRKSNTNKNFDNN